MKKHHLWIAAAFLLIGITAGCGRKKVARIGVDEQIDLSGRWNATDSRLVSEEMIKDALQRPWLENFIDSEGQRPTVIVGNIINRTDEHIVTETFTKDLERAFINSGKVDLVASAEEREQIREERMDMQEYAKEETLAEFMQEIGADFMLTGTVNSITDKEGKQKVIYYQINLELIHTETNRKAWIGEKKIKKYIKN